MFNTIVIAPLYNFLIFLVDIVPNHYLWISVALTTILFKIILIPFFKKQVRDQIVLQHLAPKMKALQEKYKNDNQNVSKEILELYKKYKVNPFTSIFLLFIQLPFLFGLYQIFFYGIEAYRDLLYSFVKFPEFVNNSFLFLNLSDKSILLGFLAGLTQYILNYYMFAKKENIEETEFLRAMNLQMKYFLPIFIGVVSIFLPAVISLYFIVSNIFGIFQEIIIKKPLEKKVKEELKD